MTRADHLPPAASATNISGFDGLRALAALTVLTYHVGQWTSFGPVGVLAPLFWELKGGVAIFFAVSGALLYLPYARAIRDGRALPELRRYAGRRAVRILPAYWVVVTAVIVGPFGAQVVGANIWRYYDLSQIYQHQTLFGGLGVAWSLCVEVTFYALLPLWAWLVSRLVRGAGRRGSLRVQLAVIGIAASACVAARGLLAGSLTAQIPGGAKTLMVALPGQLDWFAIGMALAILRAELEAGRAADSIPARLGLRTGRCVLLAVAMYVAAAHWQHGDVPLFWYGLATHVLLGVAAGLLVLAVLVPRAGHAKTSLLRPLSHPAVVWVGTVSYGIYLWHLPMRDLFRLHVFSHRASSGLPDALLRWLAVLAGALLLAAASWYLVERPLQRALRARERRSVAARRPGRGRDFGADVQSVTEGLNPPGVAADHLA